MISDGTWECHVRHQRPPANCGGGVVLRQSGSASSKRRQTGVNSSLLERISPVRTYVHQLRRDGHQDCDPDGAGEQLSAWPPAEFRPSRMVGRVTEVDRVALEHLGHPWRLWRSGTGHLGHPDRIAAASLVFVGSTD